MRYTTDVLDAIDSFARDKALRYGARNQAHPSVFCTWYYYGLTVSYEDVVTNLREMKRRKLPFDVFQIDEGWEITLGEWEPNSKFPVHMADIARQIREAGYRPGIWTSPFVAHDTASIWREHPEWILKDKKGNPCLFPMNDTVYWVFDITNPATWEYFRELYRRLAFDWGYTYHKLDIIGHCSASIVRINWSDEDEMLLEFLLEKNMLPSYCNESDKYTVCDYYGKVYKTNVKVGDKVTLGVLKPHGATVIKIEKQSGQPIIVESTGHYSMGAEGIHMAIKNESFVIQYNNTFDWAIEYKVMLPAGYVTEEGERVIMVQIPPLQKIEKEWRCKVQIKEL